MFRSANLWNGDVTALGDAATSRTVAVDFYKGYPWRKLRQRVTAPATAFKDVTVANYPTKL